MIDAVNRLVLAVIGLALTAGAVAGLLAGRGMLPLLSPAVLYERALRPLADPEGQAVAAAAGLLAVALGMWWAVRQVTRRVATGPDEVTIYHSSEVQGSNGRPPAAVRGRTRLDAAAVARAVARDLARLPGVEDAGCRLVTLGARPRLRVRADLLAEADLDAVRSSAEAVYARLCRVLGVDAIHAEVEFRPRERDTDRVI